MTFPAPKLHPLEVCICGDYRRSHEGMTGRCVLCLNSSAPWDVCSQFRSKDQVEEWMASEDFATISRRARSTRVRPGSRLALDPER